MILLPAEAMARQLLLLAAALGLPAVAVQRQGVTAGLVNEAGLAPGAQLHKHQAADVCDVVYVNLNESVDRRLGLEANMQQLGIEVRRFPAVRLDVEELPTGERNFTPESANVLLDVFSEWSCGAWTESQCQPGDQLCCKGLGLGTSVDWHVIAGASWLWERTPVSSYLGNFASHLRILQQMRGTSSADPCFGSIVMEDDMRLLPQWSEVARRAVSMAPDYDVIKLFHNYNLWGVDSSIMPSLFLSKFMGCRASCSGTGKDELCLYDLTRSVSCFRYSNGVLLVNPKSADKILRAMEQISQEFAAQHYAGHSPPGGPSWFITTPGYVYSMDMVFAGAAQQKLLKMYAVNPPVAYTAEVGWNSTYN